MPVIEYTLEFLASAGVQEVFIYCGAHSESIENFINESSRWAPGGILSPFTSLEFIRVSDATSIGDFLRDLDKRSLISGDFILVHSDLVANVPLDAALAKHRARREANRDACMTMVLRSVGTKPHRAAKARGITPAFVIDPTDGRCLQYDEFHPLQKEHYVNLDPSVFAHGEFEVRTELIDCGIDICTPEVLALWSESFDYELPRKNFLHGVLKDWELNGKFIYTEIIEGDEPGYAARASNLQLYDCISKDIIDRWTFPYVPDSNLVHNQSYKMRKGNYYEDRAVVAKGNEITRSVIGGETVVEAGTTISRSIIGRRCKIGKNVRITDSYIWDDAVIEDGATVVHSIVASRAQVGKSSYVPEGSILAHGVRIGEGQVLKGEGSRPPVVSLLTYSKERVADDASVVGKDGKGALFEDEEDDEADDYDSDDSDAGDRDPVILQKSLIYSLAGLNVSTSSISSLGSHDSYDSEDEDMDDADGHHLQTGATSPRSRLDSFNSDTSASARAADADAFHGDAVHGLVDALRADDSDDFDGAKLEFMGLRLANNASDNSMRKAIAVAFVQRASELLLDGGLEPTKAASVAFTAKNGAVKFIKEVGVGGDEVGPQTEFALALQRALVGDKAIVEAGRAGQLLAAMLQQLYNLDVLEEDGILAWWADKRVVETEGLREVRDKCRVLVEWLENAEEDDDSDEEEEDSDEEDSD